MNQSRHLVCPGCQVLNRVPIARLADAPTCGRCKRALFTGKPLALDPVAFDAHLLRGELPLLVDFWAPWCGPCLTMAPQFELAAAALEPWFRLGKVDTEAEPALGQRFGIRSIPTLVLFGQGRELGRRAGATTAADIVQWARALAA